MKSQLWGVCRSRVAPRPRAYPRLLFMEATRPRPRLKMYRFAERRVFTSAHGTQRHRLETPPPDPPPTPGCERPPPPRRRYPSFLLFVAFVDAGQEVFTAILMHYRNHCGSLEVLCLILKHFSPDHYAPFALEMAVLIKQVGGRHESPGVSTWHGWVWFYLLPF